MDGRKCRWTERSTNNQSIKKGVFHFDIPVLRITTTPPFTSLFRFCFVQTLVCSVLVESRTTKPSQTHKTKQPTPHLLPTEVEQEEDKTMDVTLVLEESGVTATVEVPCEADVAAAKEVACTALAVSPASVEMRIGTQVLEGTCRLQDTAFDAGVQVVLARRFADIKCPAKHSVPEDLCNFSLSPCGTLCLYFHLKYFSNPDGGIGSTGVGFYTETFETAFKFEIEFGGLGPAAISRCKTHCYMAFRRCLAKVALPGGEVVRKVEGNSTWVFACGGVVVSQGEDGVSVYDEDLTLLRFLSHTGCNEGYGNGMAVSDCGGWVITSSNTEQNVRLWDVNTGEAVACVPADGRHVAYSRCASVFAVECSDKVQLYDWSGAALRSVDVDGDVGDMQFTPCGKYLVVRVEGTESEYDSDDDTEDNYNTPLHQYDVATMSCVRVIPHARRFVIAPCSRVVLFESGDSYDLVSQHLYPY